MPAPTPPPPESRVSGTQPAPAPTLGTADDLERLLRASGVALVSEGEQTLEYLDAPARIYGLGEDSLEVHVYPSAALAEAAARRVSPDGTVITQPDGTRTTVAWLGSPHVYLHGPLLVVYVGSDRLVLDALAAILGRQIAGS